MPRIRFRSHVWPSLLALGLVTAAMAATPESTRLVHRGIDLADAGRHQAAIAAYSKAIELDAGNAQAWFERGMAQLELDRDREAIGDFEQALKLDPKYPGARDWLARTLVAQGDHRRAAEEWRQLLRDQPDGPHGMGVSPQSWADCAEQFALAGERAQGIALLEEYFAHHASRVTRYAVHETAPMRLLARLYDEAGEPDKAAAMRQRARASKHRVPADE